MKHNSIFKLGALLTALAILSGAFGAHALKDVLPTRSLEIYGTANQYHFIVALSLMILGVSKIPEELLKKISIFILIGGCIFSGSLYALAFTGYGLFGAITPIGGLTLILSFLYLAWKA